MTKYVTKQVTVSLAGVTVREQEALQCLLDLPIDRCLEYLRVIINKNVNWSKMSFVIVTSISYCSADPTYDRVFAVLCSEGDGTACHVFLTHKRKMVRS